MKQINANLLLQFFIYFLELLFLLLSFLQAIGLEIYKATAPSSNASIRFILHVSEDS
jgi:hypothetical protein